MPALKKPRTPEKQTLHEVMLGYGAHIRELLHNTQYPPSERRKLALAAAKHAKMLRREILEIIEKRAKTKE